MSDPTSQDPGAGRPEPASGPTEPPAAPPRPLALAVRLLYLGAALSLVDIVLPLLQWDAIRAQLATRGRLSPAALDAAATATVVVGVVVGLAATALWILNAVYNSRGRTWARVLSTVLGGLAVLRALPSLAQPGGGMGRALTFVELIVAAAVLVLIWRPESSQYYRARSGEPGPAPGL